MCLRKSPVRTAALLAACRANAQKSTGPRTPEGKARVRLNGLQHGRYCRKLHRLLPEGLSFSDRLRYNWVRRAIENCFRPATARERERALRLAIEVWCQAAGALGKKDCLTGNVAENRQVGSKRRLPQIAYQIASRHPRQSLTFWTQAWGRRARLRVGEARRPRARALMAGWHGYGRVADWSEEPLPDPERDPMGFWHWRRACERQLRAFRRARAREARRRQARQDFATRVAARYQTASLQLGRSDSHSRAGGNLLGVHEQSVMPLDRGEAPRLCGGAMFSLPAWAEGKLRENHRGRISCPDGQGGMSGRAQLDAYRPKDEL